MIFQVSKALSVEIVAYWFVTQCVIWEVVTNYSEEYSACIFHPEVVGNMRFWNVHVHMLS